MSEREQMYWYQRGWNDSARGLPLDEEDSPNYFYSIGYYDAKGI